MSESPEERRGDRELLSLQLEHLRGELEYCHRLHLAAAKDLASWSAQADLYETCCARLEREQVLHALQASTSWRITAPLRWLRRLITVRGSDRLVAATPRPATPEEARAALAQLDAQVQAILASKSWKISAPLRWRPLRRNRLATAPAPRPNAPGLAGKTSSPHSPVAETTIAAAKLAAHRSDATYHSGAPREDAPAPSAASLSQGITGGDADPAIGHAVAAVPYVRAGIPPSIAASPIAALQHRHRGQRCILVANGPSLNKMDLRFLRDEICIGMNKIFLGFHRFGFYPHYYVAINDRVVSQTFQQIAQLSCVKVIKRGAAAGLLGEDALTHLVETHPYRLAEKGEARPGFSTDLAQNGLYEGWTVTHAALQLAYYLGFAQVIIIGMDHRYTFSGAPNETRVLQGDDPNHFCSTYFGGGQTWDNPDLAHAEESYRLARAVYEQAGREIIDATLDGACTVFRKADYRELIPVAA